MHYLIITIITAIIATLAMTAFSYLYSNLVHHNFKEPQLLNLSISKITFLDLKKQNYLGWLLHLFTGVLFLFFLQLVWENFIDPNWVNTGFLGIGLGIIGAIIWKITFYFHPNPPKINLSHYIIHLILAHIVFTYTAWLILKYIIA